MTLSFPSHNRWYLVRPFTNHLSFPVSFQCENFDRSGTRIDIRTVSFFEKISVFEDLKYKCDCKNRAPVTSQGMDQVKGLLLCDLCFFVVKQ